MNILDLRRNVIDEYQRYVRSFLSVSDACLRDFIERDLAQGRLWPDALLQLNPAYESAGRVDELAKLHPLCANIFYDDQRRHALRLYRHQQEAIEQAISSPRVCWSWSIPPGTYRRRNGKRGRRKPKPNLKKKVTTTTAPSCSSSGESSASRAIAPNSGRNQIAVSP